jgi:hypothetical protein
VRLFPEEIEGRSDLIYGVWNEERGAREEIAIDHVDADQQPFAEKPSLPLSSRGYILQLHITRV